MIPGRIAPTRSELLRIRRRLERVRKGVDLLTRKRRALVADLFRVAHPAIEARTLIERHAIAASRALIAARAAGGDDLLAASGWPRRKIEVAVEVTETWGVATGAVTRIAPVHRNHAARGQSPATSPAIDAAADGFERLVESLLDAASTELRLRRLAAALARTSRQVNTLERRVAPALGGEADRIRALLEEREREDHSRLTRRRRRARDAEVAGTHDTA